ncbi:MAG: hypothetical protein ACREKL_08735 [Chthoniobacterales bacterium]
MLELVSQRQGVVIDSIDFFRTSPPQIVWPAFQYLDANAIYYGKTELAKQAGKAVAANPAVEKYVIDGMAKLPYSAATSTERTQLLVPLGHVPAPWALRLLGGYLMNDRPIADTEKTKEYGYVTNVGLAMLGLERMGFYDSPTGGEELNLNPIKQSAWRAWWKTNEGRVEQRIAEVNPTYNFTPGTAPPPPTPTPKPVAAAEYASIPTPASKPIPTPTAAATPAPIPVADHTSWAFYFGGTLFAIGALIAIMRAFRHHE